MAPVERLKRVLLSLPDLALRTGWLRDFLNGGSLHEKATVLNALCEDNERAEPEAREAILVVALLFASLGECELVEQLRAQADARHLLSLARLLRRGPPPAVHDRPARCHKPLMRGEEHRNRKRNRPHTCIGSNPRLLSRKQLLPLQE